MTTHSDHAWARCVRCERALPMSEFPDEVALVCRQCEGTQHGEAVELDAETAWDDFIMAVLEKRLGDAEEHATDLLGWFASGGTMPKSIRTDPRDGRLRTEGEILEYLEAYSGCLDPVVKDRRERDRFMS